MKMSWKRWQPVVRVGLVLAACGLYGGAAPVAAQAYSPTNVTGLTIWIDASDVNNTGSNPAHGTGVATWVNKAGAFNAAQGNSSLRPVMASGVLNDLDVVRFTRPANNTARYLEFNSAAIATLLNTTNTAIAVARANNGGGDNDTQRSMYVFARPGWHSGMTLIGHPSATSVGTTRWLGTQTTNIGQSLPYTQGQFEVITRTVKGTTTSPPASIQIFLVHTNQPATSNTTYALWNHGSSANILRLGCAHVSGNFTGGLDGDIAEILFYNRELSTEERQELEGYLAWKWGLEDSLPTDHPYVLSAPGVDLSVPIILNQPVSDLTDTSATFNGWLVSSGTSEAAVRVYWGTEDGELSSEWGNTNWWDAGAWATNTFPATNITGLAQNTTYYYTFGAVNATTNAVAKPRIAFKTLGPPAVDTAAGATSVGVSTATLNGTLANGAPASVFFDWWVDGGDVTNRVELGAPRELGGFSANVTGLTSSTDYRYQTVASNAYGTAVADASDFTTLAAAVTTGNVTWSGGGATPFWDMPANWAGNAAPTNPTTGTINYGSGGQNVTGLLETDRQVGGVSLSTVTASHNLDLGGNTMTVAGLLRSRLDGNFILANGTLRIGTDTTAGNLTAGGVSQTTGTPSILRLSPGMTFDPHHMNTLLLDSSSATHVNNQNARLDLRGVAITGGQLRANTIDIEVNYRNSGGSYIALDAATGIDAIVATNMLRIGSGTERRGRAYIGNPTDANYRLPANIDIRVGTPSIRGSLILADNHAGSNSPNDVRLWASSGGDMVAYLTNLTVMRYTGTGTSTLQAFLDLSAMTNCVIDTINLAVGLNTQGRLDGNPRGTVKLPPGVVTVGTAIIGGPAGLGFGRFETSNTVVTVTNSLLLDLTGEITINMGGEPKGIDVDGTFTDGGGSIHVNFLAAPLMAYATNWAFRVAGDVSSTLNAMAGSGRLTSSGTFAGWQVAVLADDDYTYFAMVDENLAFPPVAVAQDATFEIEPGGTVWVDISEVDAGSHDPSGRTPVSVTMSKNGAGGPFATSLSFDTEGDHPVMVKIEVGAPVIDSNTDTATVSTVPLDPGSQVNVTWLGGASTALMERREWWWKGSWLGGVPPANPTAGTITFAQYGEDVISLLEQDRQIGGISTPNSAFNHTLDLGANTLTVAATFGSYLRGSLELTNGTLRIGSAAAAGSMLLGGGDGATTPAVTILRPGMVLDTYHVDTLRLGRWPVDHINNQNARLYLRGATVAGGALSANSIRIVNTHRQSSGSYIALDANTSLSAIVATNNLLIGTGQYGGRSFIGDPNDANRRLPAGIDIRVGHPAQAGSLVVGDLWEGAQGATISLSASAGGTIEAYLTNLRVMRHTGTGTGVLNGTLDLSAMTSCLIDATTIEVGRNTHASGPTGARPRGTLRLPPGTVTAGSVIVGDDHSSGFGLLTLSNTAFTVTNTLTLARTGGIEVDIGALSTGLDIVNAAPGALAVDADATLTLRFLEPGAQQPHYGFRWDGNHATTLETMRTDGRLMIEDAGLGGPSVVIYSLHGATFIGIPPPSGTLFLLR